MNILITGGTGYIGSHTAVALTANNHKIYLHDNLANSSNQVITQLNALVGRRLSFTEGDLCDTEHLTQLLIKNKIDLVFHIAALKHNIVHNEKTAKDQSVNIKSSFSLVEAMKKAKVKNLVYSSSASVYGLAQYLLIDEAHPVEPINDYGRCKLAVENMLAELASNDPEWRIIALRYFNVAGSHDSNVLKNNNSSPSANLMSKIAQVTSGYLPYLSIYGNHYPTYDGTLVRDYVHVMDVADGHLKTIDYMCRHSGWKPVNIGSGQPTSVKDLVKIFEDITGKSIPIKILSTLGNDVPVCVANATLAKNLLNWQAQRSIKEICLSESLI